MARRLRPRVTRDGVLFIGGMAGIFHEALRKGTERPSLLFLFGAMIGLPAFLRSDEKKGGEPEPPPAPPRPKRPRPLRAEDQ